jgi:thiol:disulfide interchange protein DsbD
MSRSARRLKSGPDRGRRQLLLSLLALPIPAAVSQAGILDAAPTAGTEDSRFLPVGAAFGVRWLWTEAGAALGEFTIAPGYYLYRDRIKVALTQPAAIQLAALELPAGDLKDDPYAGRQEVFHHSFSARQPISLPAGHAGPIEIEVTWQGCAEAGLCYPPVRRRFKLRS